MVIRSIGSRVLRAGRWSVLVGMVLMGCSSEESKPPEVENPEPTLPEGCTEITLGTLVNGIQISPVKYGGQPTFQGTFGAFGDPAVADTAFIRLDANTVPGAYDLATGGSNLFTCEQCVYGYQDAGSAGQKLFVAVSGSLTVVNQVSLEQVQGVIENVTLRESVNAAPLSAPYRGSAVVSGGECKWIRRAEWSTVRPGGCDPRQGSPTANLPGQTCVAVSYAANDGTLENSQGTKTQGEACTSTPPASAEGLATTDCAQGYACSKRFTAEGQCLKVCDPLAAVPGCPGGTVCGVYGLCIEQSVLEPIGFAFDSALIGQTCTDSFAEFCGVEGARGICADLGGGAPALCYPYARARSDCGPGEELGYVSYPLSGGYDRTFGWCYPDGL
ncbi:hypothetical protein [Stigmatella erecta]|uniref:Lipoprotein n=1 Tax=Stigmatella erecta TaxID=83460 RepID=A0A1I0L3Z2_9BACT|nr:hypothetical protein [Stigmatella erecta]SEU34029.1 hypothetical protein SAMN05443639_11850 [Stigmatella erecta]